MVRTGERRVRKGRRALLLTTLDVSLKKLTGGLNRGAVGDERCYLLGSINVHASFTRSLMHKLRLIAQKF